MHRSLPKSSAPVVANFENNHIVIGGGVAIFHLATARVVIVYHPGDDCWFLPKGRRDIHESTEQGAEREGYEEPHPHVVINPELSTYTTEPLWTQMIPQTQTSQYLLFWYIAETVPPHVEEELNGREAQMRNEQGGPYQYPPKYPWDLKLRDRMAMEPGGYEPVRHTGMAADEDEVTYQSHLLPVEEAMTKLGSRTQVDVVRRGWEAIQRRRRMES
ncbi:MAG: hypothetical protein M1828_002114 [Chrysothrix sp. TS-e1954]|nr:MAG: hypothetical protein M1828_002114 [Chrysothrix sp. TS-e1954]